MVPLIKCAKGCDFQNIYFSPKMIINEFTKETKIYFFGFLGPTRINPCNIPKKYYYFLINK